MLYVTHTEHFISHFPHKPNCPNDFFCICASVASVCHRKKTLKAAHHEVQTDTGYLLKKIKCEMESQGEDGTAET